VPKGVTKHTELTDKEVDGVIDHADGSVTDGKLASGVGLSDGQICKLPVAVEGKFLKRGATVWQAGDILSNYILERIAKHLGPFWFNNHWAPTGMLPYIVGGTGIIFWADANLTLSTGTTAGSYAEVTKAAFGVGNSPSWNKKRYFAVLVAFTYGSSQYIHLVSGSLEDRTLPDNRSNHIGFKVIDDALYGTVGNSDTITESTLFLASVPTGPDLLECIFDPSAGKCEFYMNGTYKGALTTNLPTGEEAAEEMFQASIYNTADVNREVVFSEVRTLQFE
jgi:hypothetical protein